MNKNSNFLQKLGCRSSAHKKAEIYILSSSTARTGEMTTPKGEKPRKLGLIPMAEWKVSNAMPFIQLWDCEAMAYITMYNLTVCSDCCDFSAELGACLAGYMLIQGERLWSIIGLLHRLTSLRENPHH